MAEHDADEKRATGEEEKERRPKMTRAEAARKGGLAVSRDRQHMAEIGRKGGKAVSKNRQHMAEIGEKGGAARGERR